MEKKRFWMQIICLLIFCGLPFVAYGEEKKATDPEIFECYLNAMKDKRWLPTGDLMVETARFFLGRPYVAATLEQEPEQLVVNLRELDCMTLVETTMALVRTLRDENPSYEGFRCHLREARYRHGEIHDYTDRLHYTTDWIYEGEQNGRVKNVTCEIGGKTLPLNLSFMSTHPDSYRQLKGNDRRIARMAEIEKTISARSHCFIPEGEIDAHSESIRNGDMVCFVTTIPGLDLSHVGIVCREGGQLTFIHASSTLKQVVVNEGPLQDYVIDVKRNSGIMVVRPLF